MLNVSSLSCHGSVVTVRTGVSTLWPVSSLAADVGWLTGDIIAGLTVGIVLVPQVSKPLILHGCVNTYGSQSMSYATIATLSPQYGLYSAFVGVMIYCVRHPNRLRSSLLC